MNELVHATVEVLGATIGEDGRRILTRGQSARLEKDGQRIPRVERARYAPGENAPREVVDDRMHVRLGPIHEPDERRVDVPDLVRLRSARTARVPVGT